MTPTILVTGATGFAGGHLLDRLAGRGPVTGWCRPDGQRPDRARLMDWHAVDLLDSVAVRRSVEEIRPTEVYHLAGAPLVGASWRNAVPQLKANALGTHHLLDAVREAAPACRVLVVTSAQIYQPGDDPIDESAPLAPQTPYGLSKLAADQIAMHAAHEDGLDVVVARPFNHAGPRQSAEYVVSSFARQIALIEQGRAEPVIRVGNLAARRDITDVRDVVAAYTRLMDAAPRGRPYNICSGRAWRIGDLLDELLHLSSAAVTVEVDQDRLRPSDAQVMQGDASRARAELGWTPQIQVEQTLRDTLNWWREQIART
jgi:GDP-4-dehydro-6-deoxy-D-mannose reductase